MYQKTYYMSNFMIADLNEVGDDMLHWWATQLTHNIG